MSENQNPDQCKASRIAVVAIHGVGDHPPFEMARSVAALLQDVRTPGEATKYTAFEESLIRIDVEPVKPPNRIFSSPDKPATAPPFGMTHEMRWGPLDSLYRSKFVVDPKDPTTAIDHVFAEGQLSCYEPKGPEDNYQFLRLAGKRLGGGPDVHIYDMYWADLSKLGNAFTQVFGELYQLLFHLGSVGVNTVKAAAIHFDRTPPWKRFAFFEGLAAKILAWLIPFLNLIMLMFLVPALVGAILLKPGSLSPTELFMTLAVTITALITALIGAALVRSPNIGRGWFAVPVVFFLTTCVGASIWAGTQETDHFPWSRGELTTVAAALVFAATFACGQLVLSSYEKRRPGSKRAFAYIFPAFLVFATIALVRHWPSWGKDEFAILIGLRCIEVAFWMLLGSWFLFSSASVLAYATGLLAVWSVPAQPPEDRIRAAGSHRTAWLLLGLSGSVFFLLSFVGWVVATEMSNPILGAILYRPLRFGPETALSTVISEARDLAGLTFLPILLILTLTAILVAIWSFAPAVWGEVFPPAGKPDQRRTDALGNWLNRGFAFLLAAGAILWWSLIVWYPVSILYRFTHPGAGGSDAFSEPIVLAVGSIVGGAGTGLLVLRGRLNSLAGGFRTGVRVALDVDAWLREHPRASNPTGQICARYVSLLRHIVADKYDAVIIFAHSQGTVITADLLRFLAVEHDAHLKVGQRYDPTLHGLGTPDLPIFLFTMGCPLRQLYSLRFPSLYTYGANATPKSIVGHSAQLNIIQWVNAYRSGDYVGRNLWDSAPPFELNRVASNCNQIDMCIGAGAHTHYWDHTASRVGETLDKLVGGIGAKRCKPVSL